MIQKKRILIFVVTYNAEKTICNVLSRIPKNLFNDSRFDLEILIIDDSSKDNTFEHSYNFAKEHPHVPLRILNNPVNLGYGGNQKLGYKYAIDYNFDIVALLHGDGQYAPEELPRLLEPLINNKCDAVLGSRMLAPGRPLAGGMPFYKFCGNKILTFIQNKILNTDLSEYHSGYKLYSCEVLKKIPFEKNSNDFDFDTDIIIQLFLSKSHLVELPIPTFYGKEICYVNGLTYALKVLRSSILAKLQKLGLFYDPKYDLGLSPTQYEAKFHFKSSHSNALSAVSEEDTVLILGSGPLELTLPFKKKAKSITLVDQTAQKELPNLIVEDLDKINFSSADFSEDYSKVLLLDVLEHLDSPERLLGKLRDSSKTHGAKFVITVPNVAFLPIRIMLLFGSFNYGKRGILDLTHRRLFTISSLRKVFEQQGFSIGILKGIPAPFPLACKNEFLSRALLHINSALIMLSRSLFSYQIYCEAIANPTTNLLIKNAKEKSKEKIKDLN